MGSRIGEAEKKIASWGPLRARRSERNGRGLEWLSLGDTGCGWHPPVTPSSNPRALHAPATGCHGCSGAARGRSPFRRISLHRLGYGDQAVSTPMKSSTHGLLQTEGCMNCATQDTLWTSCSSKLPVRDLTLLLDLDHLPNTTLLVGTERAELKQHATGKANETNPEVRYRRVKMHGRGEALVDGEQHPLPKWYY